MRNSCPKTLTVRFRAHQIFVRISGECAALYYLSRRGVCLQSTRKECQRPVLFTTDPLKRIERKRNEPQRRQNKWGCVANAVQQRERFVCAERRQLLTDHASPEDYTVAATQKVARRLVVPARPQQRQRSCVTNSFPQEGGESNTAKEGGGEGGILFFENKIEPCDHATDLQVVRTWLGAATTSSDSAVSADVVAGERSSTAMLLRW